MLCFFYLEVGHVHSATFVIDGSTINHGRGGVNAQWLCSAGGLSLWMPGPQPQCLNMAVPALSLSRCPPEAGLLACPLCFFLHRWNFCSTPITKVGKVVALQLFLTLQ